MSQIAKTKPAPVAEISPMALMQQAVASGNMTPETLEKLMELDERNRRNMAKRAYDEAMAKFKADPPKITKDHLVSYSAKGGKTEYTHATLGNVVDTIGKALSTHGLSASWRTEQGEGGIKVTCILSHVDGHQEETSLMAAADQSGGKNSIQAVGSTVTYLQRYTLLAITGLATYEDDDARDAENSPEPPITQEQADSLRELIQAHGRDEAKLVKYLQQQRLSVTKIEEIPASKLKWLEELIKRGGK